MGREALHLSGGCDRHHLLAARHRLDEEADKYAVGTGVRIHRAAVRNRFRELPRDLDFVRVRIPIPILWLAASAMAATAGRQIVQVPMRDDIQLATDIY